VTTPYTDKNGVAKTGFITEGGSYDGVILPYGYRLIDHPTLANRKMIEKIVGGERFDPSSPYLSFLRRYGIYWVGPPPEQRGWYRFAFTEFSKVKDHEDEVIRREEPTNYFYIARVEYAVKVPEVEIGGNAQVDLLFSVFIRVVIPEIAFSENVNIIEQLNSILKAQCGTFFRKTSYNRLKTKTNDEKFSENIRKINTLETLGIEVQEVRMVDVGGKYAEDLKKAFQSQLMAQLQGDADIIKAEKTGQAKVITAEKNKIAKNLDTDAEKQRITETYSAKAQHPDMARYEAIEKAGDKGSAIVFEGPREMTDDAKSMLVTMRSSLPKDKVTDAENGEEKTETKKIKPENKPDKSKGKAKNKGERNDSSK
jgi:regulator of protease activity HflC (stomatin/prohibitin superfamily)